MNEPNSTTDLLRRIRDSAGAGYLNRSYQRSFSLNVFQMNALELMEAVQRVKDPNQGMAFMMEKNREAGRQAHRELNRHVHNFVSSALTLVDHTRAFMKKHYATTELMAAYEKQVIATFTHSPVASVVQGLRNYMLHSAVPNSSMFLHFTRAPGVTNGSGTVETGMRYDTASLLEQTKWKPMARSYLKQAGENLDLHELAHEYLALVNQFHGWLDATLAAHHQADLQELRQLQTQLQAISATMPQFRAAQAEAPEADAVDRFEFNSRQTTELDEISSDLLGQIRELHFKPIPQGFPTARPTTSIEQSEVIGSIKFWATEASEEQAFSFISHEGKCYGLSERNYNRLDGLIDAVMKSAWARSCLSREFVKNAFIDWATRRFGANGPSFPDALSTAAREEVTSVEVWAPIANMEVEHGFVFGPVRIEPITAAVMQDLENNDPVPPEQQQQVENLFEQLRREIQGFAAVVVSMEAEPALAEQRGMRIAQDAVGLIRFFSPAASMQSLLNPVALEGAEYIPTSKMIVRRKSGFILHQGLLPKNIGFWRLSTQQISELKCGLMDVAASLVVPEGLTEFALAVRSSLMTYSKGTTMADQLDRLQNCLSALEGVLLKHEMEPRAHSIANRMSYLLALLGADRENIKQAARQIYWIKDQPQLMEQGLREDELIGVFTIYSYDVLRVALENTSKFRSTTDFVNEVDRLGIASQ